MITRQNRGIRLKTSRLRTSESVSKWSKVFLLSPYMFISTKNLCWYSYQIRLKFQKSSQRKNQKIKNKRKNPRVRKRKIRRRARGNRSKRITRFSCWHALLKTSASKFSKINKSNLKTDSGPKACLMKTSFMLFQVLATKRSLRIWISNSRRSFMLKFTSILRIC